MNDLANIAEQMQLQAQIYESNNRLDEADKYRRAHEHIMAALACMNAEP